MANWKQGKDGKWTKSAVPSLPLNDLSRAGVPKLPLGGLARSGVPRLNLDEVSRYGYLKNQPGSDQAWKEKQLQDVIRVGRALDQIAAAGDPLKLAKLTDRREKASRGEAAAKSAASDAERREAIKTIGADNWGAVAGTVAALADSGREVVTTATDISGQVIKVGVFSAVAAGASTVVDIIRNRSIPYLVVNPRFEQNGWGDGESPRTKTYFQHRRMKKIGGGVFSALGSAGAAYTAVNTAGLVRHGRAVANTVAHLTHLVAEANRMKQSEHFQKLIGVIAQAKMMKLINRSGALVADAIPGCAIASAAVGAITGIPTAIRMMTMENIMTFASIELHWRAFAEQNVLRAGPVRGAAGAGSASGPAMRVVEHLYTGLLSEHHWFGVQPHEFIKEPAGWMVIRDKMSLL